MGQGRPAPILFSIKYFPVMLDLVLLLFRFRVNHSFCILNGVYPSITCHLLYHLPLDICQDNNINFHHPSSIYIPCTTYHPYHIPLFLVSSTILHLLPINFHPLSTIHNGPFLIYHFLLTIYLLQFTSYLLSFTICIKYKHTKLFITYPCIIVNFVISFNMETSNVHI